MMDFIPGLGLTRKFYLEAIRPILEFDFSCLPYSAEPIGAGSEVLGFDTEIVRLVSLTCLPQSSLRG
jgi:hypothetical protein